jgi:hypothetical protein
MKYEYKVLFVSAIGVDPDAIAKPLNKYGQHGWKLDKILVGVHEGGFLEDEKIYILILRRSFLRREFIESKSKKKGGEKE